MIGNYCQHFILITDNLPCYPYKPFDLSKRKKVNNAKVKTSKSRLFMQHYVSVGKFFKLVSENK